MMYHITYYYLAAGMNGQADTHDYGYVEANTPDQAKDKIIELCHEKDSESDKRFIKGCLTCEAVRFVPGKLQRY